MRSLWFSSFLVVAAVGCGNSAQKPADDATKTPSTTTGSTAPASAPQGKLTKLGTDDIKVGQGDPAEPGDLLFVTYTGKLADGTVFDSNDKPDGQPFSLLLGAGSVIKGWDQGLAGMKVGGTRKISIPSELGYGSAAQGDKIPANSDLFFDVKLLSMVKHGEQSTVLKKDIKKGSGPSVKKGDHVAILYTGTLVNGKIFDATSKRGNKPFEFNVGKTEVIPGMDLSVVGMKKGGEREVTIPPMLGYGPQPMGDIPPNSVLKFDITVVSIKGK